MAFRILIVDDHPITLEGVTALLEADPEFEVAGVASSARRALDLNAQLEPDLCIVDLMLPDMDGVDLALALRGQRAKLRFLMFSAAMHDGHVERVERACLDGYVFKTAASTELLSALHAISRGERHFPCRKGSSHDRLTPREQQILSMIVHGKENPEIASRLKLHLGTVKNHIHHILEKLGAHKRTQASAIALARGLVKPPEF